MWFKNYEHTRVSVEESMRKLQTDYLDLVLLHWPFSNTYAAWRELEELYAAGRIRAIGVSNYTSDRLIDLILYNKVVPAVNQIETNLISQQTEIYRWMKKYRIQHGGYAPFGQGKINALYDDPVLMYIADRYHKTVRQVVLRFQIQLGVVVIPKTMHSNRLKENFEVFDFGLEANEMEILRSFDKATPLIGNPQDPVTVASSIEW
ncbi:aldo/keto reductase [Odoribacter splanchnicus]|uniref:aldo/keto reductase n=1 Tax=Odoribacter splanchnicus TaxID=28118 RepID=UPI001864000E|nr:aldo/keto reductase [Odoribacter splanchnicus]